jgi:hypothetical protein
MEVLQKAELERLDSRVGICATIHEAVDLAKFHLALGEDLHQTLMNDTSHHAHD